MLVGLGIDIVNKARIERLFDEYSLKFVNRIFSPQELKIFKERFALLKVDADMAATNSALDAAAGAAGAAGDVELWYGDLSRSGPRYENFVSYVAKRFAAKEAVAKAVGCGIGKLLSFRDIEIFNNEKGVPFVKMNDAIVEAAFYNDSVSGAARKMGEADNRLVESGRLRIYISISDEKDNAVCMATMEYH